jgi:hypothetical protein
MPAARIAYTEKELALAGPLPGSMSPEIRIEENLQ